MYLLSFYDHHRKHIKLQYITFGAIIAHNGTYRNLYMFNSKTYH